MRNIALAFCAAILTCGVAVPVAAESLRDAVRHALTASPAIKARSSEMRATAYELMQRRADFEPMVEAFGDIGRQSVDDPGSLAAAENDIWKTRRQIGLRASLVLFDGYRRANRVYAEAARLDASIFDLLDASETMALNATEAYIDVYRHQALLAVAERNLAKHIQIGRQVRDLVEAGRLPVSDELTIDDRIGAARLAKLDIERALRDAIIRYERVIGRLPQGAMSLTRPKIPGSLHDLTAAAVANSYRVQSAQARIDQVRAQGDATLAARSPRVTLDAGVSAGDNRNGSFGNRRDEFVGLSFNWTLHQGGRAAEANALAQRIYAVSFERDAAARDVRELAGRAWNSLHSNIERNGQLHRQLAVNRALVDVYGEEFEAAKRTLLDLLEVERARFNVEFEKVSSEAAVAFSGYRVLAAQSRLAAHFGVPASEIALEPGFEGKARARVNSVFNIAIEPLE